MNKYEERDKYEYELVKQYQSGENRTQILEYFYTTYYNMMCQFALKYLYEEMEDKVHDLFLVIIHCLDMYDVDKYGKEGKFDGNNAFFHYMYTALKNNWFSYIRDIETNKRSVINGRHFSLNVAYQNTDDGASVTYKIEPSIKDEYSFDNEVDARILYGLNTFQLDIVNQLLQGKSQEDIGRSYNVSQVNISKYIERIRKIVSFNLMKIDLNCNVPNFICNVPNFVEDNDFDFSEIETIEKIQNYCFKSGYIKK